MTREHWKVAALLFFSGFCALIYQTVWMREFRLIFGASTAATAAVLAIFMGGLGAGSALLGKRADVHQRPLGYYGRLELWIAAAAGISPLLLAVAERVYFATGGSPQLGTAGATLIRLALASLVLAPATILMGGTLPAAARAVSTSDDDGRRAVALLYGINTLGAVAGALLATFVLIERLGNRVTLLAAVVVNVIVALRAQTMARTRPVHEEETVADLAPQAVRPPQAVRAPLVYAAAAIAGFAFLLMELVWYRMLSPILGGTAYMFGLVLAMALLGIGLGGAAYALLRRGHAATAGGFALTCSLEALAVAVPFALGDRLAIFAGVLRTLGGPEGFAGHVAGWVIVTFIIVFPAAFIAGVQFPLLIALLGRGRSDVGRQVGAAYAWNTAGAIAGSLAGGFGLLPLLSAPGTWRVVALLLAILAVVAAFVASRERQLVTAAITFVVAALSLAAILTTGPTATWRHSGIGVAQMPVFRNRNEVRTWSNAIGRATVWDRDGRESSVALMAVTELSFVVNGKSDGAVRGDAPTQVMVGVLPAMLHPRPVSGLVVGLGTGETAGWMAAVPSMQRVDVAELEPVVLDVARVCAPANHDALRNPKVHVTIGDAREVLLASDATYDIIASEPSNPYRAGVASLFTSEFYESARARLRKNGILAQWVQAYSIDAQTMQTVYATLRSVFPHVQTWAISTEAVSTDLILIASADPIVIDAEQLRARLGSEPFASAAYRMWDVTTPEGFLSRHVANEDFSSTAATEAQELNTDDRTVIEFGFARSAGYASTVLQEIVKGARALEATHPKFLRGAVDWNHPEMQRLESAAAVMKRARNGDATVEAFARAIIARRRIDAMMIMAALRAQQGKHDLATELLRQTFVAARTDPWPDVHALGVALEVAIHEARTDPGRARILYEALSQPFAVGLQETQRKFARIVMAPLFDKCGPAAIAALHDVEPYAFWDREMLQIRAHCYTIAKDPLALKAQADYEQWLDAEPQPVVRPRARPAPRGSS